MFFIESTYMKAKIQIYKISLPVPLLSPASEILHSYIPSQKIYEEKTMLTFTDWRNWNTASLTTRIIFEMLALENQIVCEPEISTKSAKQILSCETYFTYNHLRLVLRNIVLAGHVLNPAIPEK